MNKAKAKKEHDLLIDKWKSGEIKVEDIEKGYEEINKKYGTDYKITMYRK